MALEVLRTRSCAAFRESNEVKSGKIRSAYKRGRNVRVMQSLNLTENWISRTSDDEFRVNSQH